MDNPFSYTKIISGQAFCNRTEELKAMSGFINNSQNILLYSNRRIGKTSLIFKLIEHLGRKTKYMYIDLYGTLSESDFLSAIMSELSSIESKTDKVIRVLRTIFISGGFEFQFDPASNSTSIKPKFDLNRNLLTLEKVFKVIRKLSDKSKLVIIFDEFQEIENYSEDSFEKKLRKLIQGHQGISYIFAGSRRSILFNMFNSQKKAFYKQAEPFHLGKISSSHYKIWAKRLFLKNNVALDDELIQNALTVFENHPMYVQRFFYHLWEEGNIDENSIEKIKFILIERHENEFLSLWDSFSFNQRKVLKMIALMDGKDLFSSKAMNRVELKSASQVKRAIESLEKRDIIIKNGHYLIHDVLLKHWILQMP